MAYIRKGSSRETKTPKYKNKKVDFGGEKFDSIGERDRWIALLQDQKQGKIENLQRQVRFILRAHDMAICSYIADFVYDAHVDGDTYRVVEDFKGVLTDVFKLKAKLFLAQYGYPITITTRKSLPCKKK